MTLKLSERLHLFLLTAVLFVASGTQPGCSAGGETPQGSGGNGGRSAGTGGAPMIGGTGGAVVAGSGGRVGSGGTTPGGGSTGGAGNGCVAPRMMCNGVCVDITSDATNCGMCGKPCAAGSVCSVGQCSTSGCAGSLTKCGASCVDLMGSQNNCGMCGKSCPADQACWQGACRCATGYAVCGGTCKDVATSTINCGTCGNVCATGASCVMGMCQCPAEGLACSGACKAVNTDPQNCGKCGTVCGAGTMCLYGGCIDPTSVACSPKAEAGRTSAQAASISMGKYWVNNNQWGYKTGSGTQSIWSTCQQGDLVGWGTGWSWTGTSNAVKSYASSILGWHWGWKVGNTGMPVQISSGKKLNCGWDFTVTQSGGSLDISYDIFAHTISNAGTNDDPTDEIMIWLYKQEGAGPIGTKQATVTIGGTAWDLYRGTVNDGNNQHRWNVFSYVRVANATTSVLNIMDFMNDLVSRSWIQSSKYLSTIQSGVEVFAGTGQLITNGYYCRIQ